MMQGETRRCVSTAQTLEWRKQRQLLFHFRSSWLLRFVCRAAVGGSVLGEGGFLQERLLG